MFTIAVFQRAGRQGVRSAKLVDGVNSVLCWDMVYAKPALNRSPKECFPVTRTANSGPAEVFFCPKCQLIRTTKNLKGGGGF
jgi:hypothetical protein